MPYDYYSIKFEKVASDLAIQALILADYRFGSSDPHRIPHLGLAGNLLVKPALELVTAVAGAGVPDVWGMGFVAHAQAAHESRFCRLVRGRTDLVAVHSSLECPPVATGSGGLAASCN